MGRNRLTSKILPQVKLCYECINATDAYVQLEEKCSQASGNGTTSASSGTSSSREFYTSVLAFTSLLAQSSAVYSNQPCFPLLSLMPHFPLSAFLIVKWS